MTEPGAGSDLAGIRTSAVRDGDDWILNGSKTFISVGHQLRPRASWSRAPIPRPAHKGFSLLVVERDMEGFTRGRKLDKMGLHARTPPSCTSRTCACRTPTCSVRRVAASTT